MFIGQEVNLVELINRALNQNSYGQVYNGKQSLIKENHLLESIWKPTYQNKNKDVKQYQLYRDICLEMISDDRFQKIYDV